MAIDYATLLAEPYDPCSVLAELRPIYMKLIVEGAGVTEIRFRDRMTKFERADSASLAGLIRQLESECAAKRGMARPRAASTAGYRRVWNQ